MLGLVTFVPLYAQGVLGSTPTEAGSTIEQEEVFGPVLAVLRVASYDDGLALINVRERLLLLHDVQARFQAASKAGLFQVRLEIPL